MHQWRTAPEQDAPQFRNIKDSAELFHLKSCILIAITFLFAALWQNMSLQLFMKRTKRIFRCYISLSSARNRNLAGYF